MYPEQDEDPTDIFVPPVSNDPDDYCPSPEDYSSPLDGYYDYHADIERDFYYGEDM